MRVPHSPTVVSTYAIISTSLLLLSCVANMPGANGSTAGTGGRGDVGGSGAPGVGGGNGSLGGGNGLPSGGGSSGNPGAPSGSGGVGLGSGAAGTGGMAIGGAGAVVGAVGPAGSRRLTKDEYINTVNDLLGVDLSAPADAELLLPDEPPSGGGFRNDLAGLLPSALRTNSYETVATLVSQRVAWAGRLAVYASCTTATATCREGFVRALGRLLYRRPPTAFDLSNLTPLFTLAATTDAAGFQAGARLVLQAMLQSPHFLYRLERLDSSDPKAVATIPAMPPAAAPTPFEVATRASYLLWQSAPSPELLDAAERGDLSASATYKTTIDAMLRDGRARRGFAGYAQDWLQLYRLDVRTANAEAGVNPALITEMKQETMRFLDRVAFVGGADLSTLFTDEKTELGPALAGVYGVTPPAQGFATFDLSRDPHRIGILTQPGFMILGAAPERATIVHRGLMIMRVFLCREVPPPPANAATKINVIPANLTDRDRFAMHTSDPSCKGCHQVFDPLGYPFEPFDLAGKFRTTDAAGNVLRSDGQVNLDGSMQNFQDTAAFSNLLSRSPSVQRCFVQKMYQYAMGRSLLPNDSAAIDAVAAQFDSAGRTYVAGTTAVATTAAFRSMAANR